MTTTEQIEQAAKKLYYVLPLDDPDEAYYHSICKDFAGNCRKAFKAGADHVLGNPELMADFCTGLMEWVDATAVRSGQHRWSIGAGNDTKYYTSQALFERYLEHLKTSKA